MACLCLHWTNLFIRHEIDRENQQQERMAEEAARGHQATSLPRYLPKPKPGYEYKSYKRPEVDTALSTATTTAAVASNFQNEDLNLVTGLTGTHPPPEEIREVWEIVAAEEACMRQLSAEGAAGIKRRQTM